jgi:hypothetical protein
VSATDSPAGHGTTTPSTASKRGMDIVMLGHTAAGKTTYVSLMYDAMRTGIEGFSLRAGDPGDHDTLVAAAKRIRKGHYPPPTSQRAVFDFVLQHDGRDVLPFRWRDYRGGALTQRSVDSPDVKQLHQDLTQAQGIVVFVDSQRLLAGAGAVKEMRRITVHVQRALDARDGLVTPLVIAFTKCDLVDIDDEAVQLRLSEPFQQVAAGAAASETVCFAAVPVSCGSRELNIAVPVLFSLLYALAGRALELQRSVEGKLGAAQDAANRITLGNSLSAWWNGTSSWAEISARRRREALAEYALLEPLLGSGQRLEELLRGYGWAA